MNKKKTASSAADLHRELTLSIAANDIETALAERYAGLAKTVKMDGFRPGKVPMKILKQRYGASVQAEVLDQLVQHKVHHYLHEENIRPAFPPAVKQGAYVEGKPLDVSLVLELFPEFDLADHASITVEKLQVKVSDADVDSFLGDLAKQRPEYTPKPDAKKVEQGDAVVIDYEGLLDGVAFAGGTAKDARLVIGSGQFILGFEEQLVGKKIGTDFSIQVRFPEQYHAPELAGKETEFRIHLHRIETPTYPEIGDAFAQSIGQKDIASLRELVQKMLADKYQGSIHVYMKKQLFDALDTQLAFSVPQIMVERQFNEIWSNAMRQKEQNPEFMDKPEEALKKEYQEMAERRVKLGLYLIEVGRVEKVQVTEKDLQAALYAQMRRFPGQEQEVLRHFQSNPQAMEELKGPVFEDKIVDYLLSKVTSKEKTLALDKVEAYLQKHQVEEAA